MSHILTENGLSIVINGIPRMVPKGHPKWDQIITAVDDREALERVGLDEAVGTENLFPGRDLALAALARRYDLRPA